MKPLDFHTPLGTVRYTLYRRRTGGTWFFYFRWQKSRHRASSGSMNYADAVRTCERTIERTLNTVRSGLGSHLTLRDAVAQCMAARWPEEKRLNNRTYGDAKYRLDAFIAKHGDAILSAMNAVEATGLVQQYLSARAQTMNATTVHNDQRAISRFFAWLMQPPARLTWTVNPANKNRLTLPPKTVQIRPMPPIAAVNKLMLKAKAQRVFPVLILMQSGFRPAGCERICWNDFDWQRKTVRTSEKNLERAIPLSNWASRELAAWKRKHAKHDTHRVYPHHIELAHKELRLLRQAHGLPDSLTFGALRRLTYFRLYKAGVNPQLAARIMGNSVEIAMRHYISLETLNAHKAVRALEPRPQSVPKKRKRKAKKLRQHKAA